MSSLFDSARGLLRASIVANFGNPFTVTLPDGTSKEVSGYVRFSESEGVKAYRFLTDAELPCGSWVTHKHAPYRLSFSAMAKGRGNDVSQLIREYVMSHAPDEPQQHAEAKHNEWSEF
ncbi:hypothetical protein [Veronia pacifica]|uniref:Uncharacterized protein n=1 Tax=Veronia pacifica TaxID=1080227 RepID=A0A1C3E9F0_9GAMM|nr:hypothetical protein [Veronia pacifica]ODA29862.1 hypothetical protein A8L45_21405 [Veronia pacifica]